MEDLLKECGVKMIPGTTATLYAVCTCDIDTFPGLKTTTGVGDSITLDGDIVLEAAKKFSTIDIIPDTGEVVHTGVGERSSQNITNRLNFKLPKSIAADEWVNKNLNGCHVFIVKTKTGVNRVLGNKDVPARLMDISGTTGVTNENETSWSLALMDTIGEVAPVYEGAIDLTA